MTTKKTVINTMAYLGATISEGQPLNGVKLAPDLYRNAGLFNGLKTKFGLKKVNDYGNVGLQSIKNNELIKHSQPFPINKGDILPSVLKKLSQKIQQINSQKQNDFLLTVGGDHSIGSTTISSMLKRYQNLKLIWVDAHADMVDPTYKVRDNYNYHGMPLSHVSNVFKLNGFEWMNHIPKENIVLIGIRDIQQSEFQTIRNNKIKAFTMDHVEKYGIGNVMTQSIEYLDPKGNSPFHISFDVDSLDPSVFSQTGTLFRYGLSARQGSHIIRRVAHQRQLVSMDLVETNPELNRNNPIRPKYRQEQHYNDVTQSIGVGIDLIESAFTKYFTI